MVQVPQVVFQDLHVLCAEKELNVENKLSLFFVLNFEYRNKKKTTNIKIKNIHSYIT